MDWVSWSAHRQTWPESGRHVLACFDDDHVRVYQAYRPEIADWAVAHQQFGGPWSFSRMSWIKPNFLWMMYRCGWATKPGQERVLAIDLKRQAFDRLLASAVPSSFWPDRYADTAAWSAAVATSEVRLQWDPDHHPHGAKLERRAVQLGLRGATLRSFATDDLLAVTDTTEDVHEQAAAMERDGLQALKVPAERVYPVLEAGRVALGMPVRTDG